MKNKNYKIALKMMLFTKGFCFNIFLDFLKLSYLFVVIDGRFIFYNRNSATVF